MLQVWWIDRARFGTDTFTIHSLRPESWFPNADELGLPDSEVSRLVDRHLDGIGPMWVRATDPPIPDILEAAAREGAFAEDLSPSAGPGARLLALHLEWLRTLVAAHEASEARSAAFRERFGEGPYDGEPWRIYRDPEARAWLDAHPAPRDSKTFTELAVGLAKGEPGTAESEFGGLYALEALRLADPDPEVSQQRFDLALELASSTRDPLVQRAAVAAIGSTIGATPSESQWAALERLVKSGARADALAPMALDAAFSQGDTERARAWTEHLRSFTASWCDCRAPEHSCITWCDWLDVADVQLAASDAGDSPTWQAAIRGAAVACLWEFGDRVVGEAEATSTGTWWSWRRVDAPPGFAECLTAAEPRGPPPPPDAHLLLEIRRSAPARD